MVRGSTPAFGSLPDLNVGRQQIGLGSKRRTKTRSNPPAPRAVQLSVHEAVCQVVRVCRVHPTGVVVDVRPPVRSDAYRRTAVPIPTDPDRSAARARRTGTLRTGERCSRANSDDERSASLFETWNRLYSRADS